MTTLKTFISQLPKVGDDKFVVAYTVENQRPVLRKQWKNPSEFVKELNREVEALLSINNQFDLNAGTTLPVRAIPNGVITLKPSPNSLLPSEDRVRRVLSLVTRGAQVTLRVNGETLFVGICTEADLAQFKPQPTPTDPSLRRRHYGSSSSRSSSSSSSRRSSSSSRSSSSRRSAPSSTPRRSSRKQIGTNTRKQIGTNTRRALPSPSRNPFSGSGWSKTPSKSRSLKRLK